MKEVRVITRKEFYSMTLELLTCYREFQRDLYWTINDESSKWWLKIPLINVGLEYWGDKRHWLGCKDGFRVVNDGCHVYFFIKEDELPDLYLNPEDIIPSGYCSPSEFTAVIHRTDGKTIEVYNSQVKNWECTPHKPDFLGFYNWIRINIFKASKALLTIVKGVKICYNP